MKWFRFQLRLYVVALSLGVFGIPAAPLWAQPAARPNIVLILADDVGWGDIGFNGRTSWRTPHMDRLAREGALLRRFYTGAVVCAPSRGVLLTGKYTIHNGVRLNNEDLPADQLTIAELLQQHGYTTALFGKWHHGAPRVEGQSYVHPIDQGFGEFFGFTDAREAWEKFPKQLWFGREQKPVEGYADDMFVDRAMQFIKAQADAQRPFFLYLPLISGHGRILAVSDELEKHAGRFEEADPAKPLNATYAAMITRFDTHVGRVMNLLDELKLSKNTLLVVTSDHGATFEVLNEGASFFHDSNAPFRGQKRTLWEGGIRVPAAVRWPGVIPAGTVLDQPMHMMDLFPTIAAAAGVAPPSDLDGLNLLPAWKGEAALPERTLFWEWQSEGYNQLAAMRGDFKLVVTQGGRPELFDVVRDAAERRTLAPAQPKLAERLKTELDQWIATARPHP